MILTMANEQNNQQQQEQSEEQQQQPAAATTQQQVDADQERMRPYADKLKGMVRPEVWAKREAAAKKPAADIPPGRVQSTPDAAALAQKQAAAPSPEIQKLDQQRIRLTRELLDRNLSAADRTAKTQALRQTLADLDFASGDHTLDEADGTPLADMAERAEGLRSRYGLELPQLPATIERGPEYDRHETNFLSWSAREGIPAEVVQDLYSTFYREVISGMGHMSDAALDALEKKYTPKIGAERTALLRRWLREEVEGAT